MLWRELLAKYPQEGGGDNRRDHPRLAAAGQSAPSDGELPPNNTEALLTASGSRVLWVPAKQLRGVLRGCSAYADTRSDFLFLLFNFDFLPIFRRPRCQRQRARAASPHGVEERRASLADSDRLGKSKRNRCNCALHGRCALILVVVGGWLKQLRCMLP